VIRRDTTNDDGRDAWLLVPQIDHAEVAGKLADAWQFDSTMAGVVGDLRAAVHRHDDGWAEWDARPGVDSKSGRPVNFDEMRLADSLSIWGRSIEYATHRGPLLGYFVAGHFTRLLRRFDSWRGDSAREDLAREFLTRQEADMSESLHRLSADREVAERGVAYLQFFDAVSLWLCCAERQEPRCIDLAGGEGWTFLPAPAGEGNWQTAVDPWPLSVPQIEIEVHGRLIPCAHYRSTDELLSATIAEDLVLRWRLVPDSPAGQRERGMR
jgi:Protein of unknown function (DUF3891)